MPQFKKRVLSTLERCYAVRGMQVDGQQRLLYATEGKGACLQFALEGLAPMPNVWDEPGGTMSIVPIPGREGEFLAVQNFFPTFQSADAAIVWGCAQPDGTWKIHPFIKLPYVHRFDLLVAPTGVWFVGATLCTSKKEKDDWSDPGKVWVGKLPESADKPMQLESILEPLTRNHGYCRLTQGDVNSGVVGADEGMYQLIPPQTEGEAWRIVKLLDTPVSDMAFVDLDGDGRLECLTIEPFHGEQSHMYRWDEDGFTPIWTLPYPTEFGHVVWGGMFDGEPAFLFGYRKGEAELLLIRMQNDDVVAEVVDKGEGPSNVDVIDTEKGSIILSANRMTGWAVLYSRKEL